jgi:hypothetical protein
MDHHKCEVCGQPAAIYETAIENGVAVGSHQLCKLHGESHWRSAVQAVEARSHDALAQLAEWHRGLTDVERSRLEMEYRLMRRGR